MIHCDITLCVGCRICEVACSSFHHGAVSPALTRIHVSKLEEIGIDMAVVCFSCVEKPCLDCPTEALTVGAKGEIRLDDDLCSLCGECIDACPIGAAGNEGADPLFCDLCGGETICVQECPTGALSYRENEEVSLQPFMETRGNARQRRADYVNVQAKPIRDLWINGARVDS
jgi:Fe-S-cluster-containing hydrogenase component 2